MPGINSWHRSGAQHREGQGESKARLFSAGARKSRRDNGHKLKVRKPHSNRRNTPGRKAVESPDSVPCRTPVDTTLRNRPCSEQWLALDDFERNLQPNSSGTQTISRQASDFSLIRSRDTNVTMHLPPATQTQQRGLQGGYLHSHLQLRGIQTSLMQPPQPGSKPSAETQPKYQFRKNTFKNSH